MSAPRVARHLWAPILCLACLAPAASAQGAGSPAATCTAPEQLEVPQLAKFMADNPRYIVTRLFPLGWSASGLFAWIVTEYHDASGQITVSFQIIDTVTDRFIDGITMEYEGGAAEEQAEVLSRFWKSRHEQVCAALAAKGIARQRLALVPFPYAWRDDVIDAYVKKGSAGPSSQPASLICRSRKRGEKRIAKLRPVKAPDGPHLPSPIGAIPSPEGDRLLVLTALTLPGWEGPPSRVSFPPFGCDLSAGFRPAPPH